MNKICALHRMFVSVRTRGCGGFFFFFFKMYELIAKSLM